MSLLLVACSDNKGSDPQFAEDPPSRIDRIAKVSVILASRTPLPSEVIDADFFEQKIGDDFLGPADYRSFLYVKVSIGDVDKWVATFTPLSGKPTYVEPKQMLPWWVNRSAFSSLEFFQPEALSHRIHGWIGVSRRSGELFVFTYTM